MRGSLPIYWTMWWFVLSGPGLKSAPMLYRLFLWFSIRNFVALRAHFVNRLRHLWKNLMSKSFEKIRLKRSYNTAGIFWRSWVYYFYRFWRSKKDELLRNRPGIRISCALASRTVCEWSRCENQTFCVENRVKKRRNPWEPLKSIRWSKLPLFEL